MFNSYSEYADFQKKNIKDVESIIEINEMIKPYKWLFIHPYIQNFWLFRIRDLYKENKLTEDIVTDTFIRDFYNLHITATFIDGYCKQSDIIRPFNYYIENSIVLAYQRDYAGAINIIIPVIEGILSNYLIDFKNKDLTNDRYDKIRGAIGNIKEDIISQYAESIKRMEYYGRVIEYNQQQQKQLITYERKYLDLFCSIIDDFFKDSLFCFYDGQKNNSLLNRHQIFHSLNLDIYHTLENYIKLFNSLKFLTWLILRFEKKSILNQIDNKVAFERIVLYEELLAKSGIVTPIKHKILSSYDLYNLMDFKRKPFINDLSRELTFKQKFFVKRFKSLFYKKAINELNGQ